jgi:hypothetical protein
MYTDFFENIYKYFLELYDSYTQKPIHNCEEYDDEECLYLNQSIER